LPFDTSATADDLPAPTFIQKAQKGVGEYTSILKPISLLVLFVMAYMFVLRPIQKHALAPGQPVVAEQSSLAGAPGAGRLAAGSAEMAGETRRAAQLKEQTIETIKQKPVNTARAVQAWMREEPS
jgi:flagellar biosynthesis/type III secretory pathway M-ring protein FliF/YscJ